MLNTPHCVHSITMTMRDTESCNCVHCSTHVKVGPFVQFEFEAVSFGRVSLGCFLTDQDTLCKDKHHAIMFVSPCGPEPSGLGVSGGLGNQQQDSLALVLDVVL